MSDEHTNALPQVPAGDPPSATDLAERIRDLERQLKLVAEERRTDAKMYKFIVVTLIVALLMSPFVVAFLILHSFGGIDIP